jgi:endonuclease/exonuclease/phosphatase family metal-dependent hydrolase
MIDAPIQTLGDEQPLASYSGGVLKVVTINVWFGKLHQRLRYDALFGLLAHEQPDVIAFQEVTYDFLSQLKKQPWTAAYRWVDDHAPQLGHYGVAILTRLPIQRASYAELPSDMGRTVLLAELKLDEELLTIATTHLESGEGSVERRAEQLVAIGELLAKEGAGIFCGDLNFCSSWQLENDRLDDFDDLWSLVRPDDDGYTLDSRINLMKEGRDLAPVRFDRMLFFGEPPWSAETIQLFASECLPDHPEVWPSDHFGLLATIASKT